MSGSNSVLMRPMVWVLLAALVGVYVLYDWYSGQLSTRLDEKDARIAETVALVEQREARIAELGAEIAGLEGRVRELTDLHSSERRQLEDRIAAAEQDKVALGEAIESLRQTDAGTLAAEQAKTAAVIEERDRGIAAFEALYAQNQAASAKVAELQNELTGLRQVIADSAIEHRGQIEALERHLNERVSLAKATPKDSELMRAAQKAGLLPDTMSLDADTAAFCSQLADASASAQTELDAVRAEAAAVRDEQARRIAALEQELEQARAALAQSGPAPESSDVVDGLRERLAQTEAELEALKVESTAALDEAKETAATRLADAQARIAALTEQLEQSVAPAALAELKARSEAAEAEAARAGEELARRIEEHERRVAGLSEQLTGEQAAKTTIAKEKDAIAKELNAALARAKAELADVRSELGAARDAAASAGDKALAEARARIDSLEQAIAQERGTADRVRAAARQEADALVAGLRSLYRRFSELGGTHTERGMLLKLADTDLRFQPGQATLTTADLPSLDRLAALLSEHPNLSVRIEGHTDSLGDETLNLALSRQRAEAVKDALVQRGVAADRLSADGFGPSRPIADNAAPDGRARNRRVEVYVVEG